MSHSLYVPQIGEIVRDTAKDLPGKVMGHVGPRYQLRALQGGKEWETHPEDIQGVSQMELLSLRPFEAAHRSCARPQ